MAAYPVTVGETGARWQALASPESIREIQKGSIWEGGSPCLSPPFPTLSQEHRCVLLAEALLAETHVWEGAGLQGWVRPLATDDSQNWRQTNTEKKVPPIPRKMSLRRIPPTCESEGDRTKPGWQISCITGGPEGVDILLTLTYCCYFPYF